VAFMLFSSCNYALYFSAVHKRNPRRLFTDAEFRGTMGVMIGSSLFVAALLVWKGSVPEPWEALRMAFFNVVSVASTTGYSSTDYMQWPVFVPVFMLLLSGVATSAGSTGAGIKMARVIILFKQARREMSRIVHPRAVNPVLMSGDAVSTGTIYAVLGFMLVYGATTVVLTLMLLLSDMDFNTAFSAVVASVNNMGPGFNAIGPAGTFAGITDYQKWVLVLAMLLGRLEMLSFLVLLTPAFWRK
jgi:trk system potassium uptake protein TrkH